MKRLSVLFIILLVLSLFPSPALADCLAGQVYNGDFVSWSRGPVFVSTTPTNGMLLADGWWGGPGSNGLWMVSRGVFQPGESDFMASQPRYFLRASWLSMGGDGTPATFLENGYYAGVPPCDGGVRRFAGQTITLTYWARTTLPGLAIAPVIWQSFGSGGETPFSGTVRGPWLSLGTTWAQGRAVFQVPSIAGTRIGTDATFQDYLGFGFDLNVLMGMVDIADVRIEVMQ